MTKTANSMWGGRFAAGPDAIMEAINASIGFDRRMAAQDIAGSRAHAAMLAACGIISDSDADAIGEGLLTVLSEIETDQFPFSTALEDIHMNVEARLRDLIGEPVFEWIGTDMKLPDVNRAVAVVLQTIGKRQHVGREESNGGHRFDLAKLGLAPAGGADRQDAVTWRGETRDHAAPTGCAMGSVRIGGVEEGSAPFERSRHAEFQWNREQYRLGSSSGVSREAPLA